MLTQQVHRVPVPLKPAHAGGAPSHRQQQLPNAARWPPPIFPARVERTRWKPLSGSVRQSHMLAYRLSVAATASTIDHLGRAGGKSAQVHLMAACCAEGDRDWAALTQQQGAQGAV